MARHELTTLVTLAIALVATEAGADEPRATGLDAGTYIGLGGPGYYAGIDVGIRHQALEAGALFETAFAFLGPDVSANAVYVGAGWETDCAVTLHAAGVIGTHTWRNVGSTGLFSPGPSGDTPYAGARLLGELHSRRPVAFGVGILVMLTDDLTRREKPVPPGLFDSTSHGVRVVGDGNAFVALRLSFNLGW